MEVRHAKLLQVYGRPAKQNEFTIVPADIELNGNSFSPSFPLSGLPAKRIPPILRLPIEKHYDVSWVRGRLPHVFGISPEPSEMEKTLLATGFVAVPDGKEQAAAFECTDYYGRTSLMFSYEETDEELKKQIADAFWSILLADPEKLEDFEASVLHLGAPITMRFGCRDGDPFYEESKSN